ncbi:Methyl-CpG DNA binding protein [Corchorus capsularis]|uniref:Methyl-CpG DNA binding protein n=1 Tax=Corchorus capsularis TaxID=210143 RepID=A0A1R3HBN6_COCAP|nr:Methyl-CpG DNA binding protein [Corchorus capsularis]
MSNPVQPSTSDLPSDPLLKPGAFIDANGQDRSFETPPKRPNGSIPNGAAQGADKSPSSAEPKAKRRVVPPETWLPAGWLVEDRVRTSGATAGTVDKYYVDPSSGCKFRSKKEVLYYLETGTKRKKGTETSSGCEEVPPVVSSGKKQKKTPKKQKPLNFDFHNVPEKVNWLLTNASADSWTPFLGDGQVPESTRQDWAAAFAAKTSSSSNGFCDVGKLGKAMYLFDQLKTTGLSPSLITYNILISGFARARDAAVVAGLVKEIEERGIKPSKVTYTIVIDAFMKSENTERAFELYQFMQKAGLVPDVYTCSVLIHGLCTKGNMKEARKLFESMEEMQLKPNDVIYNTMIHGYCKEGSSYRALRMVREMGEKGMVPNVASYSSTIGLLCKDGKWQEAEALLNEMIESGFEPTVSLYNIISKAKHET